MEDKLVAEEEKRKMASKLEERSFKVWNLINNRLEMINQSVIANQEVNRKESKITNLRL